MTDLTNFLRETHWDDDDTYNYDIDSIRSSLLAIPCDSPAHLKITDMRQHCTGTVEKISISWLDYSSNDVGGDYYSTAPIPLAQIMREFNMNERGTLYTHLQRWQRDANAASVSANVEMARLNAAIGEPNASS